jgi:hypothetical protein
MWIKVNNNKFWLVEMTESGKLIVKYSPDEEYTGILDMEYSLNNGRRRYQYIISMYNPDSVIVVRDNATLSMAYSAISTRMALEAL